MDIDNMTTQKRGPMNLNLNGKLQAKNAYLDGNIDQVYPIPKNSSRNGEIGVRHNNRQNSPVQVVMMTKHGPTFGEFHSSIESMMPP